MSRRREYEFDRNSLSEISAFATEWTSVRGVLCATCLTRALDEALHPAPSEFEAAIRRARGRPCCADRISDLCDACKADLVAVVHEAQASSITIAGIWRRYPFFRPDCQCERRPNAVSQRGSHVRQAQGG